MAPYADDLMGEVRDAMTFQISQNKSSACESVLLDTLCFIMVYRS